LSSDLLQDLSVYISLALLFGIASQFRAMDGESFLRRVTSSFERKVGTLFAVVIVTSLFSPLLLNDVLILILTPIIIGHAKQSRADIAPLLVAEIAFTNIASSLTPLGNPQNILLWGASGSTFVQFVQGTWFPLLLSGCIAAAVLWPLRDRVKGGGDGLLTKGPLVPALYLAIVIAAIIVSDVFGLAEYLALGAAFVVGFPFTFRSLGRVLDDFDIRSLLILFAFVASVTVVSMLAAPLLRGYVLPVADGSQPYTALFVGGVSNVISNVPATQLVLSVVSVSPHVAPKIAVAAGLAGNIDPIGSFANILALLMVRRAGLPIKKTILLQFVVGILAFIPALL
jgi:Na+/H+ antiporter NhaD/arsenite permease-like protein